MGRVAGAIVVGALLGVLGSRYVFVGSWLNLIPWALAGLALGARSRKSEWPMVGGTYGFALSFVFMLAGYNGRASWVTRVPAFAVLGMVGATCGLVLSFTGFTIARAFGRTRE
jgi:hypothetical protein